MLRSVAPLNKKPESRLFVNTGNLFYAKFGHVIFVSTFPETSIRDPHRLMKAFQLAVLISAIEHLRGVLTPAPAPLQPPPRGWRLTR